MQGKKDILAVVGPIGCGKTACLKNIVPQIGISQASIIDVDKYGGGRNKNYRVRESINHIRGTVAVENGGGIFFSQEFTDATTTTITGVLAPIELVEFCKKFIFPSKKRYQYGIRNFEEIFLKYWSLCKSTTHPCGISFKEMRDIFVRRMTDTCQWRAEQGIYHLGYTGEQKKTGYFADEEAMIAILCEVLERNLQSQIHILLWARASQIPIHSFVYDSGTHQVSLYRPK